MFFILLNWLKGIEKIKLWIVNNIEKIIKGMFVEFDILYLIFVLFKEFEIYMK